MYERNFKRSNWIKIELSLLVWEMGCLERTKLKTFWLWSLVARPCKINACPCATPYPFLLTYCTYIGTSLFISNLSWLDLIFQFLIFGLTHMDGLNMRPFLPNFCVIIKFLVIKNNMAFRLLVLLKYINFQLKSVKEKTKK